MGVELGVGIVKTVLRDRAQETLVRAYGRVMEGMHGSKLRATKQHPSADGPSHSFVQQLGFAFLFPGRRRLGAWSCEELIERGCGIFVSIVIVIITVNAIFIAVGVTIVSVAVYTVVINVVLDAIAIGASKSIQARTDCKFHSVLVFKG